MGKYTYDTWGKVLSVTDANGTLITDTNHIGHRNPIRYRGYYYDIETGLYYLQSRYYDPEAGSFVQSADVSTLTPSSINGVNLYNYANNNLIGNTGLAKEINGTVLTSSQTITLIPSHTVIISDTGTVSDNCWNLHWENEWFDTDWPGILVVSNSTFELINWGLTGYKGSLFFDNNEQHSIYNGSLNISLYAGVNLKEKKYGAEIGGSVGRLGYDGKFIDIQVDFLTAKFFCIYDKGKFKFDYGLNWFDVGMSIDIAAIIESWKGDD